MTYRADQRLGNTNQAIEGNLPRPSGRLLRSIEQGQYRPDEIELRWRVFMATLFYGHTAPEPHKKFLVEYKRKTVRRPAWYIRSLRALERFVQKGPGVA